ncbi:MAG TPA: hypothetical protein VHH36_09455 [Candidatus Thermoplasmatota archaeon]|nr:hypothetical protein [Candidatus Thermoplasmatota archaeon]
MEGPFLWLSQDPPPSGFRRVPPGGLCLGAFVFLERGGKLLLVKYAEHERWPELAGLDPERQRVHGRGWTVPASHLKLGEDPREAGRRVVEEILGLRGVALSEPAVETEFAVAPRFPHRGLHMDVWFFLSGEAPAAWARPPWLREMALVDPGALSAADFGRSHEDVVARWLGRRGR